MTRDDSRSWESLRLKDRIAPGVDVLFVGINPGVRSAQTGHHFAGYSNRFWKLLYDSRLVAERLTCESDHRLPEFGFGITNLVARPTPGIDTLSPAEYVEGWRILNRKVRRYRPKVLALVGVTLWRAIAPLLTMPDGQRAALGQTRRLGLLPIQVHGAAVFVLPNPSGRNANFSYGEMLEVFQQLRDYAATSPSTGCKDCP